MILLTGLYEEADPTRRDEFLECLRLNAANVRLDEIHVFIEEPANRAQVLASHPPLDSAKIRWIAHGRRLKYADLFAHANQYLPGHRVIIANADIFFDHTLQWLDGVDLTGKLLCLSRWEVQPDGTSYFFDHPSSQDAWIFTAPIVAFQCNFYLGVPGCDNRLAWEAANAGLVLSNPGHTVRAQHLHMSLVHHYDQRQRLVGPVLAVPADPVSEPAREARAVPAETRRNGAERVPMPMSEPIFALTSLSPAPYSAALIKACIKSWRDAGLHVRAFNHPSELPALERLYDVAFVPVTETSEEVFGKPFIPIHAMLRWAAEQDAPVLLINSDIQLRMADWEMKRLRWLADQGLCYFVRYNHDGDPSLARREPHGVDAFLCHGRDAVLFPDSFMSMGQPYWDYWLPYTFATHDRPIYAVEFPAAFHHNHPARWSWQNWHRCALEFDRLTGLLGQDRSFEACVGMSLRVRQSFASRRIPVRQQPAAIRDWVQAKFAYPRPKLFLELGSHLGTDTEWLAAIPDVTIHAFEPDPRNHQPPRPNVMLHRAAIADYDGRGPIILSQQGWGQQWTHSSSIKQPKNHLIRFPVTFGAAVEVETITLDSFYQRHGLGIIDFIWADIQGAEGEMVRGGLRTLAHTRYLYTEYSDDELYENQATLSEILAMLPDFRAVELWPDDVLLENQKLKG